MAEPACRRHDLSGRVWALLESSLPGRKGAWGGKAKDNRLFINAVFQILRTGAPWRDLPSDYGGWKKTHRRFCRWRDKGIWEALLEQLVAEPDHEWLMIDASHVKVHPHAVTASRRGTMTRRFIGIGTWWKTHSCTSSAGGALRRGTPKTPRHSWSPDKSSASHFGRPSCADPI